MMMVAQNIIVSLKRTQRGGRVGRERETDRLTNPIPYTRPGHPVVLCVYCVWLTCKGRVQPATPLCNIRVYMYLFTWCTKIDAHTHMHAHACTYTDTCTLTLTHVHSH